jgi:hypothetical protein
MIRVMAGSLAACMVLALLSPSANAQQPEPADRPVEERHTISVFTGYLVTNRGNLDLGPRPGLASGCRYDTGDPLAKLPSANPPSVPWSPVHASTSYAIRPRIVPHHLTNGGVTHSEQVWAGAVGS